MPRPLRSRCAPIVSRVRGPRTWPLATARVGYGFLGVISTKPLAAFSRAESISPRRCRLLRSSVSLRSNMVSPTRLPRVQATWAEPVNQSPLAAERRVRLVASRQPRASARQAAAVSAAAVTQVNGGGAAKSK